MSAEDGFYGGDVRRVRTTTGSKVEPPLNQRWSKLTKLQWHAAVAMLDTDSGLRIRVTPSEYSIGGIFQRNYYCVSTQRSGSAPHDFHSAWTYINGLRAGFSAAAVSLGSGENQ